jgi:hypothetical protein
VSVAANITGAATIPIVTRANWIRFIFFMSFSFWF